MQFLIGIAVMPEHPLCFGNVIWQPRGQSFLKLGNNPPKTIRWLPNYLSYFLCINAAVLSPCSECLLTKTMVFVSLHTEKIHGFVMACGCRSRSWARDFGSCFLFARLKGFITTTILKFLEAGSSCCQKCNCFHLKCQLFQCVLQHFNYFAYGKKQRHKILKAKESLPHHNYFLQSLTYIFIIIQMFLYRKFYILNGKLCPINATALAALMRHSNSGTVHCWFCHQITHWLFRKTDLCSKLLHLSYCQRICCPLM